MVRPSACMVGSVNNGGRDADFREITGTKPKRARHRTQAFRGRHRRSVAAAGRRNLAPGLARE